VSIDTRSLRVVLVRYGEALEERFFDKPQKITIGVSKRDTFHIPDARLGSTVWLFRPSSDGHSFVLRLVEGMSGTLAVNLHEMPVSHFLSQGRGIADGQYRDQPLASSDWGIIGLDENGDIAAFFQFVAADFGPSSKRSLLGRSK
jgi:hypothetical protein